MKHAEVIKIFIRLTVLILLVSMVVACVDAEKVPVKPSAMNSCSLLMDTNTNAMSSGKIYRCDTIDGILYIMEGYDMEFVP